MSLPAEVLPQLHHRSALSGQPEGQRGLWILCEGTSSAVPNVREETQRHRCPNRQTSGSVSPRPSRERNVTICPLCNLRCHRAYVSFRPCIVFVVLDLTSLHTLFSTHPPRRQPSVLTNTVTSSFTPLTSFFFLLSPSLSLSLSPQWCERNEQCRRLQLRDLLVAPLQRLTRYPLLLRNIAKRCQTEDESGGLQAVAEQVDTSICEQRAPP